MGCLARRNLHRRVLGEPQSSQEPLRGARVPVVGSETPQEDVFREGVRSRVRNEAEILGAGSSGGPNKEHEVDEEPGVSSNGHRERDEPLSLGPLTGVSSCR